jgi:signal transduction histidine kinase
MLRHCETGCVRMSLEPDCLPDARLLPGLAELAELLPFRLFVVDGRHRILFPMQPGEADTPGRIHDSDCSFCRRRSETCPVNETLADGQRRQVVLPAGEGGGSRELELIPFEVDGERRLLVVQRDLDAAAAELSRVHGSLERRLRQLDIMNQVLAGLQQSRDLDRILRVILAGITFGKGLEFNRAFYFDRQGDEIVGRHATGPVDGAEAAQIWMRRDLAELSLGQLLDTVGPDDEQRPIQQLVGGLRLHLAAVPAQLREALRRNRCSRLTIPAQREPGGLCLLEQVGCSEAWIAPVRTLAAGAEGESEWRGFLLVDNAITHRQPSEEHLDALEACARHLGFALERARLNAELDRRLHELETAYAELDRNKARLIEAEKMAAVGRVSGNLIHELKTPIVSIGGFSRLLVRELEHMPGTRERAEIVLRESKRIEQVLAGLMDYSAPQALRLEELDLAHWLRQQAERHRELLLDNGIRLELIVPGGPLMRLADPLRLDQLLHSLLQNAIDLNAESQRCRELRLCLEHDGDEARLRIADDGPGFDETSAARAFEPFWSGREGAVGLGLTLAQDIARQHGGELELRPPVPGQGAELVLHLPWRTHGQTVVRG